MEPTTDHQETMFEDQTSFAPSFEGEESYSSAEELQARSSDHGQNHSQNHPDQSAESGDVPDVMDALPLPVLSADDFAGLEERILRAVSLVRSERQARRSAEERVVALEVEVAQLQAQAPAVEILRQEVASLRVEREQVRHRVERLLGQLDALEL